MSLPLRTLDGSPAPAATRHRDPFATRTRRSLWIAGVAAASFLILLIAVFFNLSTATLLAGIGGAMFLLALVPFMRIFERTSKLDFFSPYVIFPILYTFWLLPSSKCLPISPGSAHTSSTRSPIGCLAFTPQASPHTLPAWCSAT
jgi:hypothetical protein